MANRCELMCPAKEMLNYEYVQASGLKKRLLAVQIGVQGVGLVLRANTECPKRDEPAETWTPDEACSVRAQQIAAKLGPLTVENTTEHQQESFGLAGIEIVGLPEDTPTEEPPKTV